MSGATSTASSVVQALKNARRRTLETVFRDMGLSEKTIDEEYQLHKNNFDSMVLDMNECGASLSSTLSHQKQMFSDSQHLASALSRIYLDSNSNNWPGVTNELQLSLAGDAYKSCWDIIHDVIRSSCAAMSDEQGLQPLKATITRICPDIEKLQKERDLKLIDCDAYRRKLKALEKKKDDIDKAGKGQTKAATDAVNEITKFTGKLDRSKAQYDELNAQTKHDMISAKKAHDALIDILLTTVVVSQYEMFSRAAAQLEQVIKVLPQDKVRQVRARIDSFISQGGIRPKALAVKSEIEKGVDIIIGKAVPSDFIDDANNSSYTDDGKNSSSSGGGIVSAIASVFQPAVNATSTNTASTAATLVNAGSTNPYDDDTPQYVIGLYDHNAEADDELSFKVGDKVQVLESIEGGWWKGRLGDAEGLFPLNYVRILDN